MPAITPDQWNHKPHLLDGPAGQQRPTAIEAMIDDATTGHQVVLMIDMTTSGAQLLLTVASQRQVPVA